MDTVEKYLALCIAGLVGLLIMILALGATAYIDDHADDFVGRLKASTVRIYDDEGLGSGVVVGKNRVLTAAHVVGSKSVMNVKMADGSVRIGHVVWVGGPTHDIAMLDVDTKGMMAAHLRCSPLKNGETVFSYGAPFGIPDVLTKGIVANTAGITDAFVPEDMKALLLASLPKGLVLVNLTIIPGNSGGGVYDKDGELVGLSDLLIFPDLTAIVSASGELCPALNR